MSTLEFRWTVSRGRDTYGYNICSLYVDGHKVASCNGGGYDMKGTSFGNWLARAYADRLRALKPEQMPENWHWERADKPRQLCANVACDSVYLPHDVDKCPNCGGETRIDCHDGKRVDDGRYFYGLTFHDPNYDPSKAKIGTDCTDRTLGPGAEGKTVAEAEAAGVSFGLERYQAFYSASSKVPTDRHTVPKIDGACGFESAMKIATAIGLTFERVPTRSKNVDIWRCEDAA